MRRQRRCVDAFGCVAEALRLDVRVRPARAVGLDCAAAEVGLAMVLLFEAVRSDDPARCVYGATELAVVALRVVAELPDVFRVSFAEGYLLAQRRVWDELRSSCATYPRRWVSLHEGLGVVAEEAVEFGEAAGAGDVVHARAEAIQVAAMATRFLADLASASVPHQKVVA